jgi:hypothetical protein
LPTRVRSGKTLQTPGTLYAISAKKLWLGRPGLAITMEGKMDFGIILFSLIVILLIIFLSFRGIKYKALLEKFLLKGNLTEDDEKQLDNFAAKFKISKKSTDEIRIQRMKKDTQSIINRIYSNQLFSEDDETQIINIANRHRITVDLDNPDFRKFRTYWMRSNTKTHREFQNSKNMPFSSASIKTKDDYEKLNKQIELLNKKYESTNSDDESKKIEKEIEKLDKIWETTRDKVWGWQFIPELTLLETDDKIFDLAYKIFENKKDVNDIIKNHPEYENDFTELTFEDDPEDRPAYIATLKQINYISKEDIHLNEILKKIDDLSKPYEKYLKLYLSDSQLSVGQFVVASILANEKAPIPFILVQEGYINRDDYLKIDPTEFSKRKGVGPKTVQQLIDYKKFVSEYATEKDWNF